MPTVNTAVTFRRLGSEPLDADERVADISARNALAARYIGQSCYVLSENKTYRLEGGITNSDWVDRDDYYKKSETYSKSEVYNKTENYTKAEVNALIPDVNNLIWQQSFFDRTGFASSASGTGATANITQINEATVYTPAQGVFLLRSGTTSTGSASTRRDSTNGVAYQYYFDNTYFRFDTWVIFSEIPTAAKQFYYLKSFHSTTGPGSDNRIEIRMAWNTTISPNRAVFSISTKVGTGTTYTAFADTTNALFVPTANTWYKLSLEINKSTNTYNLYINNVLAAFLSDPSVTPNNGYYGMFIAFINTLGTYPSSVVCGIDHYKETIKLASPQLL